MPERRYSILSTSNLPFERVGKIPDSIDIRVLAFTEISARNDENIKSEITKFAKKKLTVLFTSAHAVKFVARLLSGKPDWRIYCTRNETRVAAIHSFGSNNIANYADNALALSKCLIEDKIKEAIFFCGDQRMDILPNNLKDNGIKLTELIVYDTRLTPETVLEQPDAILFFSPTAVKSFFSMNQLSPDTTVFAMGNTTAVALKQFTNSPVIISPESDKAFVLNMAMKYAESHPIP